MNSSTRISRRGLGRLALAGLTAASSLTAAKKKIPIAVQLYSVRQIAEKDLAGVLAHVAKTGYQGVEFAGYYGHPAEEIRKMLDQNKLRAAGTHIGIDTLLGDKLEQTLAFNKTIGNHILIVPGLPQKYRDSIEAWKNTAKIFSEIAAKVKPQGFVVGYHNHTDEFKPVDGQIPFDVFFGNASPDVKVQLDIGHARRAGADPLAVINRYKGRVISVHIKEYSPTNPDAVLGEGVLEWKKIIPALEKTGGTEWFIVEEEGESCKEYSCIDTAYSRLKGMV